MWLIMSLFQSIFNRFWQTFAVYSKDWRTVANMVLAEYKGFITGLSGIATLVVLAMFIVNFMMMALDADNANKRSEKIQSLLHCAIAAAGLGSVTLIVGFFWNIFS
jgi:dihydrodipicolinate synthase/N-acetylneuraminate lyase